MGFNSTFKRLTPDGPARDLVAVPTAVVRFYPTKLLYKRQNIVILKFNLGALVMSVAHKFQAPRRHGD